MQDRAGLVVRWSTETLSFSEMIRGWPRKRRPWFIIIVPIKDRGIPMYPQPSLPVVKISQFIRLYHKALRSLGGQPEKSRQCFGQIFGNTKSGENENLIDHWRCFRISRVHLLWLARAKQKQKQKDAHPQATRFFLKKNHVFTCVFDHLLRVAFQKRGALDITTGFLTRISGVVEVTCTWPSFTCEYSQISCCSTWREGNRCEQSGND